MSETTYFANNSSQVCGINWNLCFLCQTGTSKDKMRCPLNQSKRFNIKAGYKTLENNINDLAAMNKLPFFLNVKLLKEDNMSISETLIKNNAKWHVLCGCKINNKEIVRAKKRTAKEMEENQQVIRFLYIL